MTRYYSKMRPVAPGTFPNAGAVEIHNYDERTYIPECGCEAWGYIEYDRELTDAEISAYEFVKAAPGWTGRADYDERRQERIDRLYQRAGAEEYAARREHQRAHDLVADIPFGQPNITGRPALPRLRKKSIAAMERGMEHDRKAAHYETRAEAAENNNTISADDPAALKKLREKLEGMEARQRMMKAVNAYFRTHGTLDGCSDLSDADRAEIEKRWYSGWYEGIAFPPYELSNASGNIRRVKARIADLERRAASPAPEGWTFDGGEAVANVAENRLQLFFEAIPDDDIRAALKSHGFRWARSVGAWQRQLTDNAVYAAKRIVPPVGA